MSINSYSASNTVCLPLKTVHELLSWSSEGKGLRGSRISLSQFSRPCPRPKLLLCHDLKGGYLEDRFIQGSVDCDAYSFWHWWLIDSFVYFSHYLVTIPPPCWIDAGHLHGVIVLGTFITEWDEGEKKCASFLQCEETYRLVADKLVAIAMWYGFDGWLMNIENKLELEAVIAMRNFIEYLTREMHRSIPHSRVIWYDSVTCDGELNWQNELDDKNRLFFESCDGIFLNYTWKVESLERSAAEARSAGRPFDVYVGIDIYGRGCPGGGGFNTVEAMTAAQKYNLSVALFAPGWTFETAKSQQEFLENETKFWHLIVDCCPRRLLTRLPLATSFSRGTGSKYFVNGCQISGCRWTNMSLLQTQPTTVVSFPPSSNTDTNLSYTEENGFNGGGCLCISMSHSEANSQRVCLFTCDVEINTSLSLTFAYKLLKEMDTAANANAAVGSRIDRSPANQPSMLLIFKLSTDDYFGHVLAASHSDGFAGATTFLPGLDAAATVYDKSCSVGMKVIVDTTGNYEEIKGWIVRSYRVSLASVANSHLTEISLVIPAGSQRMDFLLGQLQVTHGDDCSIFVDGSITFVKLPPLSSDDSLPSNELTPVLSWTVPKEWKTSVSHYIVYERLLSAVTSQKTSATDALHSVLLPFASDQSTQSDEESSAQLASRDTEVLESRAFDQAVDNKGKTHLVSTDHIPSSLVAESASVYMSSNLDGKRFCLGFSPQPYFNLPAAVDAASSFEVQPVLLNGDVQPIWHIRLL